MKKLAFCVFVPAFCVFFATQLMAEDIAKSKGPDSGMSSTHGMKDSLGKIAEKPPGKIPVEAFNPPVKSQSASQLLSAIGNNDIEEVIRLIQSGEDVNADIASGGLTALMISETPEMVKALLAHGADVNQQDAKGATALHHLMFVNRAEEILPLLIKAGADVNIVAKGLNDETPFLAGRALFFEGRDFSRATNIMRLLYRSGASIDSQDADGYTALITAVVNNKTRMARFMLLLGANADLRSADGKTALDYAKELGFQDIEDSLINTPE